MERTSVRLTGADDWNPTYKCGNRHKRGPDPPRPHYEDMSRRRTGKLWSGVKRRRLPNLGNEIRIRVYSPERDH